MSKELSSRLTSGLITSISGPDFETRVKILSQKASEHGLIISDEIIQYLASRLTSLLNLLQANRPMQGESYAHKPLFDIFLTN